MPSSPVVIGVDSSTQSTKAAVVDTGSGRLLAVGRSPHTVTGEGGARESDPEMWWRALCGAVASAVAASGAAPSAVAAIAVAGQQHGLVTLDAAGRPLRPALLWNDTRSAPQAAALVRSLGGAGAWSARTGSVPVAAMTATKWQWLRENEPGTADAAAAVRLPHDFLTERLAGTAVTDPGDASGTCWYSTATGAYDPELLGLVGLDPALLPAVAGSGAERIGSLTRRAAEALGLPEGLAVAAGTGDNMAAAVGLGLGGSGLLDHPVVSLGTSGTVFAATRARPSSPALAGFATTDGGHLPLACTLNCTLAVDKVAGLLGLDREDAEPGGEAVLLPYLDGERTPDLPYASGLLTGLRHTTTPRQLLGAAYEGAVFTLLRALDQLPLGDDGGGGHEGGGVGAAGHGVDARPLRLIGGGARGRFWVDTVRRLSGRAVLIPESGELVALGAAALAAGAATGRDPVAVATAWGTARGRELPAVPRDEDARRRIEGVLGDVTARTGRRRG
ncbi:xylulokinase [Streptomyces sp. NPDC049910]|uniref:xylulokinase n=1 Tax=Streptomyces sp. NPDC049910 TaxID=3155278 RepID=UPI003422BC97